RQWVDGTDPDLRRSALMGFGEIGPSVADIALPYLTDELKSPHSSARYLAVETLSKLGPAAKPLLEVAAGDADKLVRDRANQILARR
ncbi:MAG: HEAT repeat domain-containing protein, partial [Vicinamibacterales bacterium]